MWLFPSTLGFWAREPFLRNSAEVAQAPGWLQDTSLLPAAEFNELMPVKFLELPPSSKQRHQDFPGDSQVNCPHSQLGDPAHPQITASHSQHRPESSCRWRSHTLHQTQELTGFLFFCFSLSGWFSLTWHKSRRQLCRLHETQHDDEMWEWPGSQWSCLCYWLLYVMCFPFPWKTEIKFLWGSFSPSANLAISSPQEFLLSFHSGQKLAHLYGHSPRYKIMWKLKSLRKDWGITELAWAVLSNARALVHEQWDLFYKSSEQAWEPMNRQQRWQRPCRTGI